MLFLSHFKFSADLQYSTSTYRNQSFIYSFTFQCVPAIMASFFKGGEEQQKATQEARENLKTLEGGLEGKHYFGGEKIGFADVAIGWLGCWVQILEEIVGMQLIDAKSMAKLKAWFDEFLDLPIIRECMPPRHKLMEHTKAFHKVLTSSST